MQGYERVAVDAEWKWQEDARAEFQMVLTFPAPVMGDNTLHILCLSNGSVVWMGQRLDWESSEY